MKRVWAVAMFTIRDAVTRRVWYPFTAMLLLAFASIFMQFGRTLAWQNPYADNIISSFFWMWSWGAVGTAMILGGTALPVERRARALFVLPIERWQLMLGKLIGSRR